MLKILKMTKKWFWKARAVTLHIHVLRMATFFIYHHYTVTKGSVDVKVSLTLFENKRNDSIFKKVHDFLGHPVYYIDTAKSPVRINIIARNSHDTHR